jgi:hypothetical protein
LDIGQIIVKANLSRELLKELNDVFKQIREELYNRWLLSDTSEWSTIKVELLVIQNVINKLTAAVENGKIAEDDLQNKED